MDNYNVSVEIIEDNFSEEVAAVGAEIKFKNNGVIIAEHYLNFEDVTKIMMDDFMKVLVLEEGNALINSDGGNGSCDIKISGRFIKFETCHFSSNTSFTVVKTPELMSVFEKITETIQTSNIA